MGGGKSRIIVNRRRDGAAVQLFVLFTAAVPRTKLKPTMKTVELLKAYFTEDEILQLAINAQTEKLNAVKHVQYSTGLHIAQANAIIDRLITELNKETT